MLGSGGTRGAKLLRRAEPTTGSRPGVGAGVVRAMLRPRPRLELHLHLSKLSGRLNVTFLDLELCILGVFVL